MPSADEAKQARPIFKVSEEDIPGTRHAMEYIATKGFVYFCLFFAIIGGFLFAGGLLAGGLDDLFRLVGRLERQEAALMTLIGFLGFWLFFPAFMFLYFARHLLLSVKRLERTITESGQCGASGPARDRH